MFGMLSQGLQKSGVVFFTHRANYLASWFGQRREMTITQYAGDGKVGYVQYVHPY